MGASVMSTVINNLVEMGHFIKQFEDKTFVIKMGGAMMHSQNEKEAFMDDVIFIKKLGIKIVLVHGGGQFITKRLENLGIKTEFVDGYRVTDATAIQEVEMLLSGQINSDLTMLFNNKGIKAVGVSGKDSALLMATKKDMHCDHVGQIQKVNLDYIDLLLNHDIMPIVAPIGFDQNGTTYNINADDVASEICAALKAEKLVLVTDVKGVYKTFGDEDSFCSTLTAKEASTFVDQGVIEGGMLPKIQSCVNSLSKGTKSTHIISGLIKHSLLKEVFSNDGIGTMIL